MPTETQGVNILTAWEDLLQALEEGGDEDLQVVKDLHVLCLVGGADVHRGLFRDIHERAEGIRQVLGRREGER